MQFDTETICLRTTPLREHDQVVVFYTADHGELSAVVKGVKKTTSKLAGVCSPFTVNHVHFREGRQLHLVTQYQRLHSFEHIHHDVARLAVGSVFVEVIRHLGQANDADSHVIFEQLSQSLNQLNDLDMPWEQTSLAFHMAMLTLSGFAPSFSMCIHCHEPLELTEVPYYAFSAALGGFLCHNPACLENTDAVDRVNVSTHTMALLKDPMQTSLEGQFVLKAHRFLAYYWQTRLEKPFKSFVLFQLIES